MTFTSINICTSKNGSAGSWEVSAWSSATQTARPTRTAAASNGSHGKDGHEDGDAHEDGGDQQREHGKDRDGARQLSKHVEDKWDHHLNRQAEDEILLVVEEQLVAIT